MTRTFLDAGVLIAAARGTGVIALRAHAIPDDPERVFVTSDYIRMEVLPKALYHRQRQEVLLYERFFSRAVQIVPRELFPMIGLSSLVEDQGCCDTAIGQERTASALQ